MLTQFETDILMSSIRLEVVESYRIKSHSCVVTRPGLSAQDILRTLKLSFQIPMIVFYLLDNKQYC